MDIQARKNLFEEWRKNRRGRNATRFYLDEYVANIDAPPIMREARALAALYAEMPIDLRCGSEIAGVNCCREPVGFHYSCGTWINEEIARELAADDAGIWNDVDRVRARAYMAANPDVYSPAELRSIEAVAATSTWFGGHMVIDYERILDIGLDGYAREIALAREKKSGREAFYDALEIMLSAIQHFLERCAKACGGSDENESKNGGNSGGENCGEKLSEIFSHIAHAPPATFHQALQLVWMLHLLNGSDSFGRLDFYLDPFYKADIAAGRISESRAAELVADLIINVEADGAIQNMTLGGVDKKGCDFYPPLTKIILRVAKELGYKGPNLCLRVTPTMPEEVWDEALASIASGNGLPALYNDGFCTASLARRGIPLEEARGHCFAGCSQLMIPGMSNFMNDIGMLNVAKICELAMHGGFDPRTGVQAGPLGVKAERCETFGELLAAFYAQLDYFAGVEVSMHNKELPYRASCEGYAMRTLFMRDCIEAGMNVNEGGARRNNIELELIGITNAADHLYAIKKTVFEDKLYGIGELASALENDFEGCEEMRARLYETVPKFGNDIDGPDEIRAEISRRLYARFNESRSCLGGVFIPGEVIFTAHDWCGAATGATADGRRAGAVLADSAGASQGRDMGGPTALMNSVLKIPAAGHLLTSIILNLRFLPHVFAHERRRRAVRSLFAGFFAQGGTQLQINVCDAQTLRDAQQNPALHQSLIVRVGGYSDYFVRLPRALQDEIIQRTAQAIA